jgi:hypothetical protein
VSAPGSTEPGPLADEAVRLFAAAADWLHRNLADPATAKVATGAPECTWCPLCQLVAVLRGDRPEVAARLAETQTAVVGLLRALADAAGAGAPPNPGPDGRGSSAGGRIQKIDLGPPSGGRDTDQDGT